MSMVMCERCDRMIDSDDDPDCFVENPGLPGSMGDQVLCEWCRETLLKIAEHEAGNEPH